MKKYVVALVLLVLVSCSRSDQNIQPDVKLHLEPGIESAIPTQSQTQSKSFCPDDMKEIEGYYCPVVEQICLKWVDIDGNATKAAIPAPGGSGRCGEFKYPTKCLSEKKVHKHYCIDEYEIPNLNGQIPWSWMSWYDVRDFCVAKGKEMCTRSEWTFAAEGISMKPYPYKTGYLRDKTACNFDNHVPKGLDVFKAKSSTDETSQALDRLLVPSGSMSDCVSDFGVRDQIGNLDEWVVNEDGKPYVSGLMGGHVFGVRSRSRPMTDAHGPWFKWYESSGRCCSNSQ